MKSRILNTITLLVIGLCLLTSCKGQQNEKKISEEVPDPAMTGIEVIYCF